MSKCFHTTFDFSDMVVYIDKEIYGSIEDITWNTIIGVKDEYPTTVIIKFLTVNNILLPNINHSNIVIQFCNEYGEGMYYELTDCSVVEVTNNVRTEFGYVDIMKCNCKSSQRMKGVKDGMYE